MLSIKEKYRLVGFAVGIFVCYTLYGYLQERLFRGKYGKESERFDFAGAFVAIQFIVYSFVAKGDLIIIFFVQR